MLFAASACRWLTVCTAYRGVQPPAAPPEFDGMGPGNQLRPPVHLFVMQCPITYF